MTTQPQPHEYGELSELYPTATLRETYLTLLKHRFAVLAVVLAVWTVGGFSKYLKTPLYRASALIQIDWGKLNLVEEVLVDPNRGAADLYGTQAKILKSRLLAERVVQDLELWESALFSSAAEGADPRKRVQRIARAIQGMVEVQRIEKTQLMQVSFVSPDPVLSAELANAQVAQYIRFNVASESGLARDTSSFIQEEITKIRADIMTKERALGEYSRERALVMGETRDDNIVVQKLEALNGRLTEAEAARVAAEARYRSLSQAGPQSLEAVRNSAAIGELERKRRELRERRQELSSTFGPDWPEMRRLEKAVAEIDETLAAALREEAGNVVAAARVDYQRALDHERLIRRALEEQKSRVAEMQGAAATYDQLRLELDNQRKLLQDLLRRRSETELTADLGEKQPVQVKIIERAEIPEGPYAPGSTRGVVLFLLLSLALGVGTAYLLDHWDDTIHNVEDLKRHVSLPYLGMIPRYGEENVLTQLGRRLTSGRSEEPVSRPELTLAAKRSSYLPTLYDRRPALAENRNTLSERFRFLRGSVLLSTPGSVPKVMLVTSPEKACGKTFVSSNLSYALGQLDKKVLLIDSDLRNPRLHKVFHYRNRVGLTNVLTGQKPLEDGCIMRTDLPNLFLLMAGPRSPNPGELLASPAMDKMLKAAAEHFDFVVLDSAPLLPVFDSHVLSTRCDGVILVTRAGVTSRSAARTSIELIERVNGKVTGVVLNDVNLEDYAQYYYHSHYSYEYGRYPTEEERVVRG